MGPTNVALVKLFQADQQLRAARERLDAAAKNVRVQERRVNDTAAKLKAAQQHHRELQARSGALDLDLRSRDAHIEKLRTQQQSAKNNKEYQAFLIEINTAKLDKGKVEDEAMRSMEQVDKAAAEAAGLATQLEAEKVRHAELAAQSGEILKALQVEVDALVPARQAAAAGLSAKVLAEFDRLADRFDGEPLSALAKPDRRREEYLCTACNMDLVTDVYNKLHSRDELVYCPSCRRLLFIPEDLPPEAAIGKAKPTPRKVTVVTRRKAWTKDEFFERVAQFDIPGLQDAHRKLLTALTGARRLTPKFDAKGDVLASYNVFVTGVKQHLVRVRADGTLMVGWQPLILADLRPIAEEFRAAVRPVVKEPDNPNGSESGDKSGLPSLDVDAFVGILERVAASVAASGKASAAAAASAADPDVVEIEQRAKGKLGEVLAKAQGESVSRAAAADHKPFEFEVYVDGDLAGIYKGISAENLERAIKYFLGEAGLTGVVRVAPILGAQSAEVESPPGASAQESGGEQSPAPAPGDQLDSNPTDTQPAEADAPTTA